MKNKELQFTYKETCALIELFTDLDEDSPGYLKPEEKSAWEKIKAIKQAQENSHKISQLKKRLYANNPSA